MAATSPCFLDDHLSLLSEEQDLLGPDSESPNLNANPVLRGIASAAVNLNANPVVRGIAAAAAVNLNANPVVSAGIAAVNGVGSGIVTVNLNANPVVSEEEVLLLEPDSSQSRNLINANRVGSGIAAVNEGVRGIAAADSNANPEVSGIGAVNDQFSSWDLELGDEVWPSSSSFAGLASSLNFDNDSSFLFESSKWPCFDSTPASNLVQQSVNEAKQSCDIDPLPPYPAAAAAAAGAASADPAPVSQFRLCAQPPPVLHACLLRRLLLKSSPPAATSSAVAAQTTPTAHAAPPSSLKRKRPGEGWPATTYTYSKTHHNPPRENITSAAPPPPPSSDAKASKHSFKSPSSKVSSESLRRRKMTCLFSTLRTLLPKRPLHQKDHCLTINEACDYIHSLEKQLHILKVKMYILNSLLVFHTNQNSMPFQEGYENQDCEVSRQAQISIMKNHDMIYITIGCCEKIHGLFSNIIIILEQCGLEVIDANLSKGKDTIVYGFHLKVREKAHSYNE